MDKPIIINQIKPILESNENKKVFAQLKGEWITNIWYEKFFLALCIAWTFFSIGYFIFRWLF